MKMLTKAIEAAYFGMAELEEVRGPGGLRIERDTFFKPRPLSKVRGVDV